jgi:glycine/D-amino acid oxidase-like deaminating enzyme
MAESVVAQKFDVIVVGNGAIGSFIACDLIQKYPKLKIAIIGPEHRLNSASAAAGAMANVFAEMELPYSKSSRDTFQKYLHLGIDGTKGWSEFLSRYSLSELVVTAKNTLVFLKKESSVFERANFTEMIRVASDYGVYEDYSVVDFTKSLPNGKRTVETVARIKGEYALDSRSLLSIMDSFLRQNHITFINEKVIGITSRNLIFVNTKNEKFQAEKLILAAGADTGSLIDDPSIVPMLQGVGSAFLFKPSKKRFPEIFHENVIRTVNRGGAQCGFHVVPRMDGFYLGAGNYITFPSESSHRLETLRYLFQTLETELIDKDLSYDLVGSLAKGHRPRSLDGLPMIGELNSSPNIFVATGTNRAGLTWAPAISRQVLAWMSGNVLEKEYIDWKPDRKLVTFGTPEEALKYFVESRIGAALEHGLIANESLAIQSRKDELYKLGEGMLAQVQIRFSEESFVPHPDHWSPILETDFSCFR